MNGCWETEQLMCPACEAKVSLGTYNSAESLLAHGSSRSDMGSFLTILAPSVAGAHTQMVRARLSNFLSHVLI